MTWGRQTDIVCWYTQKSPGVGINEPAKASPYMQNATRIQSKCTFDHQNHKHAISKVLSVCALFLE